MMTMTVSGHLVFRRPWAKNSSILMNQSADKGAYQRRGRAVTLRGQVEVGPSWSDLGGLGCEDEVRGGSGGGSRAGI